MNGRDKRKRVKARLLKNEVGLETIPKAAEPKNGKYCRVRKTKIDISVCTVQSVRTPDLCRGCE